MSVKVDKSIPCFQLPCVEDDQVKELVKKIPISLIRANTESSIAPAMETFVLDTLPGMFKKLLQGSQYTKATAQVASLKDVRIRCGHIKDSNEYEVYVRYLAAVGGMKNVFKQIYLSGPFKGMVYAYGKPPKNKNYRLNVVEMMHEIAMAQSFRSSEYIVPVYVVARRKDPSRLKGIKMPWCKGDSLYSFLAKPSQLASFKERIQIAIDIAHGLKEIHDQNMCHMDVKSPNVLLRWNAQRWRGVLCDLGRVCRTGTVHALPVSSRQYMAPEQIACNQPASPSMDMWNLGLILFELINGLDENHYTGANTETVAAKEFFKPENFPVIRSYWLQTQNAIVQQLDDSLPVDRLIKWLLSVDPNARPTAGEVIEELERCNRLL